MTVFFGADELSDERIAACLYQLIEGEIEMTINPHKPCHNCADCTVGCHANCAKYRAFVAMNERKKASQRRDTAVMFLGGKAKI